jgi:L,D-transpeptidase YcbB
MASRGFHRLAWMSLLLLVCAGRGSVRRDAVQAKDKSESSEARSQPHNLTAEDEAALRNLLDAAELPDLQRPNFSSYQNEAKAFYKAFGDTLPWAQQGKPTPQALVIIRALKNAEYEGLRPEDYDGARWDERLAQLERSPAPESSLVRFDVALTVCAMRYVSDLHVGRVNPRQFHYDLEISHTKFDLSEFLREKLVASQDIDSALASAEPPFPLYRRTKAALKTYLDLARRDDGALLPIPAKTIEPGDSYAGVPRLARLLALVGDMPSEGQHADNLYQGDLVAGVKRFQQRHGIEPSGLLGAPTVRQLNIPLSHRVDQLELTMERLRWLPHDFDRPPIVVNIPEFRLRAADEKYHWALSMNVVVGKAYGNHETPVFASQIKAVTFRPYWNVPESITLAEMLPHVKKNPRYLADNDYEIVDSSGALVNEGIVNPEIENRLRSGDLRVRQKPGPKNALGLIKFEIPSPYDVYLHSTPETGLFSKSRRDFSHGCIRVEKPVALAEWLLQGQPEWTEDQIEAAMNGDKTFEVKLDRPVPVLIVYGTAVVMEDGEVHFLNDIYRQDADLERALSEGPARRAND